MALEGFSDFERTALASFFRLADQHTPAYVQVDDPVKADFSVINADRTMLVERMVAARRVNHAVYVGAGAPDDAIARVMRPIEPAQILRGLDQLVALRTMRLGVDAGQMTTPFVADMPAGPSGAGHLDLLLHDIGPGPSGVDAAEDAPSPAEPRPGRGGGNGNGGNGGGRAALVVDDSAIARKFLVARLQRFGYRAQMATSGAEALQLAAAHRFSVVFLDVSIGGKGVPDGLQVCQQLRLQSQADSAPPAIVLVSPSPSPAERVRGSLAGCDGYLSKPLLEPEFIEVLASVDPAFRAPPAAG